jgi:hypothetical protein
MKEAITAMIASLDIVLAMAYLDLTDGPSPPGH